MPRTQVQTLNRFEVLGKIPKPSFPSSFTPVYHTKETKLLIQSSKADHIFASGDFDYQKHFQKEKYFKSNVVPKTRRFYGFILVDTESVQISHMKNNEVTNIAYSKYKIFKIISEKDWGQNPFTHKRFLQNFVPHTFDYLDYKEAWYNTFFVKPSSYSWFFNWGENFQNALTNWFQEWWFFMGASSNIFCSEIKKIF